MSVDPAASPLERKTGFHPSRREGVRIKRLVGGYVVYSNKR